MEDHDTALRFVEEAGLYLMQKLEPSDAIQIEEELYEYDALVESLMNKLDSFSNKLGRLEQVMILYEAARKIAHV